MSGCKAASYNGGSETLQDVALQHTIGYIREFSAQASAYQIKRTEEGLVLLNRSITLLSTKTQPQYFSPDHLEIAKYFIDLHALMSALDVDSELMWSCVNLLQHCSRNLEARQALVDEYRFVSLLSLVLKRTVKQERVFKLLTLLQELTYGIRITWEEPYLVVLLEELVQTVYAEGDDTEEPHALLALSILVNLCYKNFAVLFLFLRSVNISHFSRRIQNFGLLANKMFIILSEDIHAFEQRELHVFLRTAMASLGDCIKYWNVPQLKHVVDFLVDSKDHAGLRLAMLTYEHYCEDIARLLDQLESRCGMDDSNEDMRKHQQICIGLIFQLITYILELSSVPEVNGKENCISLDSNVPRIFEFLCNWVESENCGEDAVHLLDALLRLTKRETVAPRIARDPSIVVQLITISETTETRPQHTTAIMQLLLTLLKQSKTEKVILAKINESYFDKILSPLLMLKAELNNKHTIAQSEIDKCVFCLLLLINFASIAKKAYFDKCCTLLDVQQIQYALARSMLGGNERVSAAVFQISQFENFPEAAVSKHIATICNTTNNVAQSQRPSDIDDQWRNLNSIIKNHRNFVDKAIEQRLNALIEVISTAERNKQLQHVPTSQIIELYNYRIDILNGSERSMQKRLEEASCEITKCTHRINIQNAEIEKYRSVNFELHVKQDRLQTQCNDLKQQKEKLKCTVTELLKKLSEQSETLQINEKRLSVKLAEMSVLQEECIGLKSQLCDEQKKSESAQKENALRIDKLKKSVAAYERDLNEKARTLEEKEKDLLKTHKLLEEEKDARKKSDDLVSVLETQLQEKKEQVNNLETELKETEDLRKTIMSLMESKKPKRKA